MNAYQEKQVARQLDEMAEYLVTRDDRPSAETVGGLIYMVWETRKLLGLPDIDDLKPL